MGRTSARDPGQGVAVARGVFNVVGGLWPLVHLRSFEWIFGPKTDVWLQRTTGGLLVSAGLAQLAAAPGPQGPVQARRIGLGTALTLLAVDQHLAAVRPRKGNRTSEEGDRLSNRPSADTGHPAGGRR
ncbi:hypothetical protein [Streptomyces sp. NPDC050759]|uniref:hypothetical protein n=1 Tax=Streptomyces sp. NPDC050759 TaxID=3365635 RepID=UPI0037B5E84C